MPACERAQTPGGSAQVEVDMASRNQEVSLAAYLPNEVRAHAGDTVTFRSRFSGEPHTVTLGRLVDRAASANAERILSGGLDEAPELKQIPALTPLDLGDGRNRLLRPCYLRGGTAKDILSCAAGPRPEYDGRQSFFSSGVLPVGGRFRVKLSEQTPAGAYAFFCLVHRAKMMGQITVVNPAVKLPSPEHLRARADEQRASAQNALKAAVQQADRPPPDAALAGVSLPQLTNSQANTFVPARASIPAGGSVTWTAFGTHVIAFNPPRQVSPIVVSPRPLRFNRAALAPAGGPPPPHRPPVKFSPASEQPVPSVVDGGSWDGTGFKSSGMLFSFAPALLAYKLTFTNPGTYPFRCLVRPAMRGSVEVLNN